MSVNQINRCRTQAPRPLRWPAALTVDWKLRRLPRFAGLAGFHYRGTDISTWVCCIGVWISSLVAIWMSRGWVGLFLSGQVLSTGTFLWKGAAGSLQFVCSPEIVSNEPALQCADRYHATEKFLPLRRRQCEISQ